MEILNTQNNPTVSEKDKQYAMFIHLSQFAGLLIPLLGWVLPLILWQTKKNTSAFIDTNGKIVMNWIISSLIYGIICYLLVFLLIGFVLLPALGICSIIFIIIGSIKANNGEMWPYPLSIHFIK